MRKLLIICLLFSASQAFSQTEKDPYGKQWAMADSLMVKSLPVSAKEVVMEIYNDAKNRNRQSEQLKAQIYLLHITAQNTEDADAVTIAQAEKEAAGARFPYDAVWHSIIAEMYWNYYSMNRWKILQRTRVDSAQGTDLAFWDANTFYNKISALYQASIARAAELQKIPIDELDPVLTDGVNTGNLRPTVYDLLAFRAVAYFENDEKELTRPAYSFTISGSEYFADAETFAKLRLRSKDTGSLHFKALMLYQQILAFHGKDKQPDALIDADLQRLLFVYTYSLDQNKKQLYEQALKKIVAAYPGNMQTSVAQYRLLELTDHYDYYNEDDEGNDKTDLPALRKGLERLVKDYPNSEGASMAERKLLEINRKTIYARAEAVLLPGEYNKFLLSYRNINKAYLRLVAADESMLPDNYANADTRSALTTKTPISSWEESLPGTEDLRLHNAEIKTNPLQPGVYAVLVSDGAEFNKDSNQIFCVVFQVSSLSFVQKQKKNDKVVGYVLDRKTGRPVEGADVKIYGGRYENSGFKTMLLTETRTGIDGAVSSPHKKEDGNKLKIEKGQDKLVVQSYMPLQANDRSGIIDQTDTVSMFFTDRSIYRPGQTVYYKGILFAISKDGKKRTAVARYRDEITFENENNSQIDSAVKTTNDFGSFAGSFVIPSGMMNGTYAINDDFSGSAEIRVEEYKRPKFEVQFDTLKSSYTLNDKITVTGSAISYSGAPIGGANVNYTVTRYTRFNYPVFFRVSYGASQQVKQGTAETKADGSFSVSFVAAPDSSIDPKALPTFQYTVSAEVTDLNGETHNARQIFNAGYHALDLLLSLPRSNEPGELKKIAVTTQNLNGYFKETKVRLKIQLLESPKQFYRTRYWKAPDQFVMNEQNFRELFPKDEYKNENDHEHWVVKETVYDKVIATTRDNTVAVPQGVWKENGWYRVEATTDDGKGHALKQKVYAEVINKELPGRRFTPIVLEWAGKKTMVLHSYFNDVRVLVKEEGENQSLVTLLTIKGHEARYELRGTEPGATVSVLIIKDNRAYPAEKQRQKDDETEQSGTLNTTWATHRDKLTPGAKETWTVTVSGKDKDKVGAEMVATLYDASLDAFAQSNWNYIAIDAELDNRRQRIDHYYNQTRNWDFSSNFRSINSMQINYHHDNKLSDYYKAYRMLATPLRELIGRLPTRSTAYMAATSVGVYQQKSGNADISGARSKGDLYIIDGVAVNGDVKSTSLKEVALTVTPGVVFTPPGNGGSPAPIQIRKNLSETAFFYPQLRTDAEGNIKIEFTMPEALTEWKLMTFAHTKDMKYGMLSGKVKTQKDLMVVPGLPRFFRQGDDMVLATKINNLSDKELSGKAELQILDAQTLKPLNIQFRIKEAVTGFKVAAGQSSAASWSVHIPESLYEPVVVRITAGAGDFTDGEENTLPVITNRMLVTETLPLWMSGSGTKTFSLDKLKYADSSKTLAQHMLTVEYTSNPAWYAVQALPYLMEYPYECTEQTFNRYYANALAAHVLDKAPKVKAVFDKWRTEDTAALLSNLEKNQELKSALLEETPWVMEAKSETEQKHRVAILFATSRLKNEQDATLRKLEDMQMGDGGFSWFKGGNYADRYITQYIAIGVERLRHLGVTNKGANAVAAKATAYLDRELKNEYEKLLREKNVKPDEQHIGYLEIEQLYLHSFAKATDTAVAKAYEYYKKQAVKYWPSFNAYMKGMIATALHRGGDKQTAATIIQSLKETAIQNEERGMYWKRTNSWWWYEAPVETQALLIECFNEVAKDTQSVEAMKRWLLTQKQTQNWETTKATADACYALLLSGTHWLNSDPAVTIKLGSETIDSKAQKQEAGTGYFKTSFNREQVKADMGNVTVTSSGASSAQWGAVYWQYFENLDKITSAATGVVVRKQLFISKNTDNGPLLTAITDKNVLKVGDKVTVRIEITSDRDMEYVHLKDVRGACFEPINVLSEYKYQGGLGYYESTKDLSSNFFISYMQKGKYVFEYPVYVTNVGEFSVGIATLQCMYAPEFSSHSEGVRVRVK